MIDKKVVFFGSGGFGLKTLQILVENGFVPDFVITTPPQFKKFQNISAKLKVAAFESIKDAEVAEKLKSLNPDVFILASYGKILPKEILLIPKFGVLNIHPSLLPDLRGPGPIQTAILQGKKETGVTIILADEEIDHGPIIAQEKIEINKYDDYLSLGDKLAEKGAILLLRVLPDYLAGKIKPLEQNHDKATFTKIFRKEDGKIDWNEASENILAKLRALNPWPGTYTFWKDKNNKTNRLIILKAQIPAYRGLTSGNRTGEIIFKDKSLFAGAKDGFIELLKVKPEGKNIMTGESFYRGHQEIKNFF